MKLKLKIDDRVASICKGTLNVFKKALDYAVDVGAILTICAVLLFMAVRAPEMHGQWLRHSVGSKVYTIRDNENSGGGTGFAIKAPSGATYILTNDHVCGVSKDKQTLLIQDDDGLSMRRRIISRSNFTDLCLVEGVPGVEGLQMGSEPKIGQIVAAIGHPSLLPLTLTRGEIITAADAAVLEGPISFFNPETGQEQQIPPEQGGITPEQCSQPKNRKVDQNIDFGLFMIRVKMCVVVTEGAYRTNMQIQPGSSGSPVVNFWGHVVGVVFAGDRSMWGIDVSQKDIVKFLQNY